MIMTRWKRSLSSSSMKNNARRDAEQCSLSPRWPNFPQRSHEPHLRSRPRCLQHITLRTLLIDGHSSRRKIFSLSSSGTMLDPNCISPLVPAVSKAPAVHDSSSTTRPLLAESGLAPHQGHKKAHASDLPTQDRSATGYTNM